MVFPFLHVEEKKRQVQRGDVTCLRLYGWQGVEPALELPLPGRKVRRWVWGQAKERLWVTEWSVGVASPVSHPHTPVHCAYLVLGHRVEAVVPRSLWNLPGSLVGMELCISMSGKKISRRGFAKRENQVSL